MNYTEIMRFSKKKCLFIKYIIGRSVRQVILKVFKQDIIMVTT